MAVAVNAPHAFLLFVSWIHRLVPRPIRPIVPATFIGYALINGSGFLVDIAFLALFHNVFGWVYPVAVTVGYALAGLYSLVLNKWLNFQVRGHFLRQGSRYFVGLAAQYLIFVLGLSWLLFHWGVAAELARLISACCEGVFLYAVIRLWVFKGAAGPTLDMVRA